MWVSRFAESRARGPFGSHFPMATMHGHDVLLVAGGLGLAPSANIGNEVAMFEAVHGSAPDLAGQGVANPSGLLLGAIQMLVHVGRPDHANTIANAWLKTLEDGIHTVDKLRAE